MIVPIVHTTRQRGTAHPQPAHCGHTRHVGTCPSCQRAAQQRSEAQLAAAAAARDTWATRALPARIALTGRRKPSTITMPALLNELASPSLSVPSHKAA
jgi:hypothetical protein